MASATESTEQFIDRFRQSLHSQNLSADPNLPALIAEYGRLCEEANQRLAECYALYKRGRYSNAVALADREPNLLELCGLLLLPEREQLAGVAQVRGIASPALVNQDWAKSLQEAYDNDEAATDDLNLLHRLTLARAPLPTRLAVMRRLSSQNPNRSFLVADIRTFERSWFQHALPFVQPFVKQGRPEVIEEVIHDLQEGGYSERAPSTLISQLQAQMAKAHGAQLPLLAAEIRHAYSAQSVETLTRLAAKWRTVSAAAAIPDAHQRFDVTEALDWLRRRSNEDRERQQREAQESRASESTQTDSSVHREPGPTDRGPTDRARETWGGAAPLPPASRFSKVIDRLIAALRTGRAIVVLLLAGVGFLVAVWATWVLGHPSGGEEIVRNAAFAQALKDIENVPPGGDVKPKLEAARKLAITELEKKEIERLEHSRISAQPGPKDDRREREFNQQVSALNEAVAKLRDVARHGRDLGQYREKAEDFRRQLSQLRDRAHQSGFDESELRTAEKSLDGIESAGAFSVSLAAFQAKMEGRKAKQESLELLAEFLDKTVARFSPDSDSVRHAKAALTTLPVWIKTLEVQTLLESDNFVTLQINDEDWKGQPPFGPLSAAREYAEMLRNRDPAIKESKSANLKERLSGKDIVNLWVIRQFRGDLARSYSNAQPTGGNGVLHVDVLRNSEGEKARVPFGAERQFERAPQSVFAERAASLWEPAEPAKWHETLARLYDELLESKKMDELLKLDLARRFLNLAVSASLGYRELLEGQQGFKSVTGISALIEGNWLDPGNDDELKGRRARADELVANAPRLHPIAAQAAARDERRLSALKRSLVLSGWIRRDDEARTVLARFDDAKPAGGSRLYTVASGTWVVLGSVSADSTEILLSDTAREYIGWPVFALLFTR